MTETWRDKQAARPDPIMEGLVALLGTEDVRTEEVAEADVLTVKGWRERFIDAIDAYEAATAIYNQCDEPGCQREATCGFPVEDGYRRTCGDHYTLYRQLTPP